MSELYDYDRGEEAGDRDAFEEWRFSCLHKRHPLRRDEDGEYVDEDVMLMWEGFLAALSWVRYHNTVTPKVPD